MDWTELRILVTGGTGFFGKAFVEALLRDHAPKELVIFSRDELKQHEMRAAGPNHASVRWVIDARNIIEATLHRGVHEIKQIVDVLK